MLKYLIITYADPADQKNSMDVWFNIKPTQIAQKWAKRVQLAQASGYPIDNPDRFYGFGPIEEQEAQAVAHMKMLTDQISKLRTESLPELVSVHDQETLNFLHHVFEVEHGLLDAKDTSSDLSQLLGELNVHVHRCESIQRGANSRHVVTYYGLPKTETLTDEDCKHLETDVKFGHVYINYVEIGKTLHDLYTDNDKYIKPEAFRPFNHYSADFVVQLHSDPRQGLTNQLKMYYDERQQFFNSLGYSWQILNKRIGNIPVAELSARTGPSKGMDLIKSIENKQYVKQVQIR